MLLGLCACDKGSSDSADGKADSSAKTQADDKKEGDTKAASDKPVPSCDDVVKNIASFNEESGEAEKKIWNKMCAEMSDEEKTCVAAAKDMDGMKACIKKDKKLDE